DENENQYENKNEDGREDENGECPVRIRHSFSIFIFILIDDSENSLRSLRFLLFSTESDTVPGANQSPTEANEGNEESESSLERTGHWIDDSERLSGKLTLEVFRRLIHIGIRMPQPQRDKSLEQSGIQQFG